MKTYWGWWYSSTHFLTTALWRWVVSFMPQPLYSWGKTPLYPLVRRLGESRCWWWWWWCGEDKEIHSLLGIETWFSSLWLGHYTDWSTLAPTVLVNLYKLQSSSLCSILTCCYFILCNAKYFPNLLSKNLQFIFFPQDNKPLFIPPQKKNRQNCFVYPGLQCLGKYMEYLVFEVNNERHFQNLFFSHFHHESLFFC